MTVNLLRTGPKRFSPSWRTQLRLKEQQVLDLHLAGVPYWRIGEQLGYADASGPCKAVQRLLRRHETEGAEAMKASEGARLDRLLVAIWPKAVAGDLAAQVECRRNRESYRRLFGLDSPVKVEQTIRSEVDEAIIRLTQEMGGTVPPPLPVPDDETAGSS